MILIYSHTVSNRLIYTLDVIFKNILKVEYQLVDLETFKNNTSQAKINYSDVTLENCVTIFPHNLLFEEGIIKQETNVDWINEIPCFFKTNDKAHINYDIFASTFYLTSRYEEYLPSTLDIHNRFQAENSMAFKNKFLEIPVVNHWALELKKLLIDLFPSIKFPTQKFKHIDTFDIDIAYAYKGKNKFRLFLSSIRTILKFDKDEIKNRYQYYIKKGKDPFDTYDKINPITDKIFFFLLGDYGKFDKNISHKSPEIKKLIQHLKTHNVIGIHPSYTTCMDAKKTSEEKNRLELIGQEKVTKSRQHFLKFSLPMTYENLISAGIKEDYSMGYASQVGFRAGICTQYPFFNLKKNETRELMIHPFQVMDGTLNEYLKLNPRQAVEKLNQIISSIKKVNGTFVSLWHNSSLSEQKNWEGWTYVYKKQNEETIRK